jgi:predicted amidohydrolase
MNRPIQRADYKDQNLKEASRLIRDAAKEGAQIVSTYEQFLDGYGFDPNKIPSLHDPNIERCENIETSKYVQALKDLSAELNITIVAGIAIKEEDKTYNSALIFDPLGNLIGRYRKTHNAGKYATWFAPLTTKQKKDNCPSFDIGPGKISIKFDFDPMNDLDIEIEVIDYELG